MRPASRHVRTVALVGIDGSGKTTQASELRRFLVRSGATVDLVHPFGWKLLPFTTSRIAPKPAGQRGAKERRRLVSQAIALLELADNTCYLWWGVLRARLRVLRGHDEVWLVSDRSFEDVVIKHRRRGTFPPRVLEGWRCGVPLTETTVWLHTPPSVAAARDGEFRLDYYAALHEVYGRAAEEGGWAVVGTGDRTPEEVFDELLSVLGLHERWSHSPEVPRKPA